MEYAASNAKNNMILPIRPDTCPGNNGDVANNKIINMAAIIVV